MRGVGDFLAAQSAANPYEAREDDMTPTLEVMTFILGALLCAVGILGGGVEIKELKIPKITFLTRMLAVIGGSVFIALGFGMEDYKRLAEAPFDRPQETVSAGSEQAQAKIGASGDATYRFWEEAHELDSYYRPMLIESYEKLNELKTANNFGVIIDNLGVYETTANLHFEHAQRESDLPIQGVDPDLLTLFAEGRSLVLREARALNEIASVFREVAHLINSGGAIPVTYDSALRDIDSELNRLENEGDDYMRRWEMMRINLSQKYDREFSGW
jgi:hypothetical protein